MRLYIGNKNYSSWSLRPWLLLRQLGIPFEEVSVKIDGFGADSQFKRTMLAINPTGRVPVLVEGELAIWESLAIVEYVAEAFPSLAIWPHDRSARARARALCSEMHAGFTALRSHCPMNIELSAPDLGARILAEQPAVASDVQRVIARWEDALARSGGPLLFGDFSAADAFFAPVATRLRSYGLPVSDIARAYIARIYALPAMEMWVAAALAEHDFLAFNEPYRSSAPTR